MPGMLMKLKDGERGFLFTRIDDSEVYFRVHREFFAATQKAGIKSLEEFVSEDPDYLKENDMFDEDDESDRQIIEDEEFFNPSDALPVVRCLRDFVQNSQGKMYMSKARRFLDNLEQLLVDAEKNGRQFHLTFELGM